MAHEADKVGALAALLHETGVAPRVRPDRVVRSTLYDLDYHVAVVACAFLINGQPRADTTRGVVPHWLKILQFVAVRPALLPDFKRWARARRRPDLDSWQKMPRGFLGDRTHDRTVEFLVAARVLYRVPDLLVSGDRFGVLESVYEQIIRTDILASERETLHELARLRVNKTILRGE